MYRQCWQLKSDPFAMRSHSRGLFFVVLLSHVGSLGCDRITQGSDFSCQHTAHTLYFKNFTLMGSRVNFESMFLFFLLPPEIAPAYV